MKRFQACHCCGLIHRLPPVGRDQRLCCSRCHTPLRPNSRPALQASRTAAIAVAALLLFWPAILLPILRVERLGQSHYSSILSGTIELLKRGDYFVGIIILLFSILFPLVKIVLLLELSMLRILHRRHKARTLRLMENLGKWSMMDVMLLAFLVMLVKLGNVVQFHLGPAVFAFVACVGLSMTASILFDPHAIWEEEV